MSDFFKHPFTLSAFGILLCAATYFIATSISKVPEPCKRVMDVTYIGNGLVALDSDKKTVCAYDVYERKWKVLITEKTPAAPTP